MPAARLGCQGAANLLRFVLKTRLVKTEFGFVNPAVVAEWAKASILIQVVWH